MPKQAHSKYLLSEWMRLWKNSLWMRKFTQTMIIKKSAVRFCFRHRILCSNTVWRMETNSSSDVGENGKSVTSHRSLPGTEIPIHRSGETHARSDVLRKCSGWFWHRGRLGTLSQGSTEHKSGLLLGGGVVAVSFSHRKVSVHRRSLYCLPCTTVACLWSSQALWFWLLLCLAAFLSQGLLGVRLTLNLHCRHWFLLPLPPKCWRYRYASTSKASFNFFFLIWFSLLSSGCL